MGHGWSRRVRSFAVSLDVVILYINCSSESQFPNCRPLSYANANVFLLCFSIVNPVSYQNITAKWYKEVIHYCPDVPLILVGTKLDLREESATISKLQALGQAPVSTQKGQELATKINAFKYMECSAMTQLGLKVSMLFSFLFSRFYFCILFLFYSFLFIMFSSILFASLLLSSLLFSILF